MMRLKFPWCHENWCCYKGKYICTYTYNTYIEIFPFHKFLIWFSNTFLFPNYPCSQKQQQQHSMSKHAIHFKFPAFIDFLHLVEIKVTRHYFYLLFLLGIIASHHFIGDLWSLKKTIRRRPPANFCHIKIWSIVNNAKFIEWGLADKWLCDSFCYH